MNPVLPSVFTGAVLAFLGAVAWWLYLSPRPWQRLTAPDLPPRAALALAAALGLAALLWIVGAYWDASVHVRTGAVPGTDDFLWPPHLVIYAGFLVSLGAAGLMSLWLYRASRRIGLRSVRDIVRQRPHAGAIFLAASYTFLALPVDALWHEVFGIDLTAWSPPHVLLILSAGAQLWAAMRLIAPILHPSRVPLLVVLAGLLVAELQLAVIEWQLPRDMLLDTHVLDSRPGWSYLAVAGVTAALPLILLRRLVAFPLAATSAALVFLAVRTGTGLLLAATGEVAPEQPALLIGGALLLDAAAALHATPVWRPVVESGLFALGFMALAVPTAIAWDSAQLGPQDAAVAFLLVLLGAFTASERIRLFPRRSTAVPQP